MKEVTDAWGNWFSGFTDGEGCFYIGKRDYKTPCTSYAYHFHILLREDDKPILEEIHDMLGIGNIYNRPACTRSGFTTQAGTSFQVTAIKECAELVKLFEKYPLKAKKRHDFEVWKQAVTEMQKPVDCRDPDLLEYYFLKIREVRKYETQEELIRPKIKELQLTLFVSDETPYN